jgi:hypothetical protein
MCLEDFFPLHVLLPRVWSRPPSRSQPYLPPRYKVNQRRALVEVRNEKPQLPLLHIHGLGCMRSQGVLQPAPHQEEEGDQHGHNRQREEDGQQGERHGVRFSPSRPRQAGDSCL